MKVDTNFLKDKRYKRTSVLHPLPRVGELDIALDKNQRAAYFQQASYGVPVRMALISMLLDFDARPRAGEIRMRLPPMANTRSTTSRAKSGIRCANPNCIVHDPQEGAYTANRFHFIPAKPPRLRCFYCETDIENFLAGHRRWHHYEAPSCRADGQAAEGCRVLRRRGRGESGRLFAGARRAESGERVMFDFVHPINGRWKGRIFWARSAFGYLLGSIPFGLIFSYLAGAGDVRKIGSGNIGATNVLRTGKKWAAAATLICDAGKGRGRGSDRARVLSAPTWRCSRRSARSSATSFRSGSASRAAKASPHSSA